MKKLLIPIFFAFACLWPCVSQAITETTSFTLSVTIPQTAGIGAMIPRAEPSTQQPVQVQVDKAIRDNQIVLLESYVTQ